jgi:hypothetical protein
MTASARGRQEVRPDHAGAATWRPAKQFLTAAKQAGVDVTDERALSTFMAGWNARSTAS